MIFQALFYKENPDSGTTVGFDKIYCAAVGGSNCTWNFSTGVLLNDADDVAVGDTALVTSGTNALLAFSPGDVIVKHDSDTIVGTVKTVTGNLITLESGSGVAITHQDELLKASPITLLLSLEQ